MGVLNLRNTKRSYDVVVSLGSWCGVADELKRHNLRRFSGPFDWVASPSLSDINRLLKNRFEGFMDMANMEVVHHSNFIVNNNDDLEITANRQTYVIQDTKYNIASWHDFPVIPNQDWTATYPAYKEKLNRRINRFLEKINSSRFTLFVRCNASESEAAELQSVLSGLTKGRFHILIVNPVEGLQEVREKNWALDRVACVEIPFVQSDQTQWRQQDWDYILKGVRVRR